ncbi:VOC family protein [uncultured Vagococcus sp.]|uniref:VOC family protein n=1 Tax=uncultured Vagococcus sp. TaxID=189676 RepID=UPI0028D45882|nr:VOC family protein [uncultured Vagococcus sp.]
MNLTNYKIQTVTLNTTDLTKMTDFYETIMGLSVLEATDSTVALGIKQTGEILLKLTQTSRPQSQTSGLYHIAYLLPNRAALGNFLRHLAITQYPIQGASDHGYSEAVYLADPEGNGIEVYADKPESQWDIKDNGIIVGVTEAMDVEGVLAAATQEFDYLAEGTFIGHVHLAVSSVPETSQFFHDILAFTITTEFGSQAAFYGKDGYHHQFAGNIWTTRNFPKNQDEAPGMNEILVRVSKEVMTETKAKMDLQHYPYHQDHQDLIFHDPNGIKFRYIVPIK